MVINSLDGAIHSSTNIMESSIVSYGTQLFHLDFFDHEISSSASDNILTLIQSLTNEKMETIFPLIIPIYEEQKLLQFQSIITREDCKF